MSDPFTSFLLFSYKKEANSGEDPSLIKLFYRYKVWVYLKKKNLLKYSPDQNPQIYQKNFVNKWQFHCLRQDGYIFMIAVVKLTDKL